jgi:hypothetical protein
MQLVIETSWNWRRRGDERDPARLLLLALGVRQRPREGY